MIVGSTGDVAHRACVTCGITCPHEEMIDPATAHRWWSARPHAAPCGAPCLGGGVRPIPHDERPPGVSGFAHAHRRDGCGTPGCRGGDALARRLRRAR